MTMTRPEQTDARLRERQTVALERQAVALERLADSLAGIDQNLATLCNYVDDTGEALTDGLGIGDAARRAYPPDPSDPDVDA